MSQRNMANMECKEKNGKVHGIRKTLGDGTNIMFCGLAHQKPFHHSAKLNCCYGKWEKTKKEITCQKCILISGRIGGPGAYK